MRFFFPGLGKDGSETGVALSLPPHNLFWEKNCVRPHTNSHSLTSFIPQRQTYVSLQTYSCFKAPCFPKLRLRDGLGRRARTSHPWSHLLPFWNTQGSAARLPHEETQRLQRLSVMCLLVHFKLWELPRTSNVETRQRGQTRASPSHPSLHRKHCLSQTCVYSKQLSPVMPHEHQ